MQVQEKLQLEYAAGEAAPTHSARLASLLALSNEPMLVWRLDGPIEFWNAGAARLYGFSAEEAIGRNSHALLKTLFPAGFAELRAQLENTGRWSGELRHFPKDGGEIIVDSRMQMLDDGTVLEVNRDITARKKIEFALRENEQRLRYLAAIVESSDDAIISKNLDGIITSWNNGAERIFGYAAEEAVGQPITMIIPEDRQSEEREILTRLRRGERIEHFETIRQRKNGGFVVVSITVSPVKNAAGRIVGASKIARDITEQQRIQKQVGVLAREAEHRSKNLLASVQAAVNLSQADTPEGLKHAISGRIQALANVHSLFAGTRWIGADLQTIAEQEFAPYTEDGRQRVAVEGPPLLLEPNAAQAIAVIIHELATNAAKYGALSVPGGHIGVSWSQDTAATLALRWVETGGPRVATPTRRGFGGRIVEQMTAQLNGKADFDWRPEGLVCEIAVHL